MFMMCAVHKQTKKREYDDDHHFQHSRMIMMLTQNSLREDGEERLDNILYVLTLPGTATIVSKPIMK